MVSLLVLFQMPRSRYNNLPLRQLPLGSHQPYSQHSVSSDCERWKYKLNWDVHDYTARAKFCTFYIKWLEWDFYDRIAKQLFLGVNHVFSCILFPLKDIQYWLQKKSLRHIKSGYWLMEMNDNNYKWRRPQFHWTEYMQNLHKIYDLILIIFSCLQV